MIFKKLFPASRQECAAIGVGEAKRRLDAGDALLVDVREADDGRPRSRRRVIGPRSDRSPLFLSARKPDNRPYGDPFHSLRFR